jgi:hypothetical protein
MRTVNNVQKMSAIIPIFDRKYWIILTTSTGNQAKNNALYLSFFWVKYFSPSRDCPRVLKFGMGP